MAVLGYIGRNPHKPTTKHKTIEILKLKHSKSGKQQTKQA